MRVSTLWQPHASLVEIGAKPFETRNYPPPDKMIGTRIAIHAAVRPCALTFFKLDWETRFAIAQALHSAGLQFVTPREMNSLPHGAIVCTAVLAGAGKVKGIDDVITRFEPGRLELMDRRGDIPEIISEDPFGFYGPGRWAWLLKDVHRLPVPVPFKGVQGWGTWDEGAAA